ncbi:MAG TPA: hypothetical protein VH165_26610 [Kofleriaceae bacterium]|nr:hypothetical protein [Kofleriaceae bacterium]
MGLLGLLAATLVASARGRAAPGDVVGRAIIAVAAVAYVGIVVAAIWTWGGATAARGRATQLRDGALVHLTVEGVRAPVTGTIAIGHGADAAIRVPGDGGEVARIEPAARGSVTVHGARLAVVHGGDGATAATARGCAIKDEIYTLPAGAALAAVECDGTRPERAFVVRNVRPGEVVGAVPGELIVAPLAWHGRFVAEQLTARVGDALRIGGGEDAIAGLTTWDVPSPHGAAAMLAVPADPTECATWLPDAGGLPPWIAELLARSQARGGPEGASPAHDKTSTGAGSGGAGATRARAEGGCLVDTGAFVLAAVALVPDADRVIDRGARAAFAIGGPPLVLLLVLAMAARRDRRARGLGRALRLCMLGASLTALCSWRLLWACRIDMLRELASTGPRLVDNQLAVVAIGAALAGNAVLAHEALVEAGPVRRAFAAVGAWGVWLVVAGLVVFGTGGPPAITAGRAAVIGLALAVALAPVLAVVAAGAAARFAPELGLVAIAFGAVAGKLAWPRSALIKLALTYAFVLAGHAALRRLLARDTSVLGRVAGMALLGTAGLALARYDAGVTVAIGGLGLTLAMLVAGHDAAYDASQAARIGVLEREHARLLVVHGAAGIAIAIGVAACALVAGDRALIVDGAVVVVNAPLVVAGLFAAAAIIARSHRRGWVPWLCAALAALAMWAARDAIVARATAGDTVGARRVAAVLDPGYAVLRDEHAFVANASAWREASLPRAAQPADRWTGEGYFGARVRDLGVSRSIDNDYLPVLIARETGIGGLMQTIGLLLVLAVGGGAVASLRLRHASREHRARWLITAVAGGLAVYQPLAALGVLPLTGISWPGLGIDSPADIWLFVTGAVWCYLCNPDAVDDERVRGTARLRRARAIVLAALGVAAVAGVIVVARAGACALGRVATEDERIDEALRYAGTIACPWPAQTGATLDAVVPASVAGTPRDDSTARFDRELRAAWSRDRPLLVSALATCRDRAGRWTLARDGEACVATLRAGVPTIRLRTERSRIDLAQERQAPGSSSGGTERSSIDLAPDRRALGPSSGSSSGGPARADGALRGACSVVLSEELIAALRAPAHAARGPRIRVVGEAMGAAAADLGELVAGPRIVRLRPGAPAAELATAAPGVTAASRVGVAGDVVLDLRATPRGVLLHGDAELFISDPGQAGQPPAWRRMSHGADVLLDRVTLIAAGPPARRRVALFRPPREWTGSPPVVDTLLADDTASVGDRARRAYPYGAAVPELGWVNPFDVDRSLGLDGWIHAALRTRDPAPAAAPACGTLAPPAIARDRVCSPSPLDGVLECRVALQPELAAKLRAIADRIVADPRPHTGRDVTPVRVAYVALRGDTGELLAQGNIVPGRGPLAYAPADAAAEASLIQLREARGESDAERVEWNLPIAVGSTFKPIVARAAEQAFGQQLATLSLTADGHGAGCKAHHGVAVDPLLGHCPPSSLADAPSSADLHDYLARSLNWYQAALGVVGLGVPGGTFTVKGEPVTLAEIAASDLAAWPASTPLQIADAGGPIVDGHNLVLDGVRRAPLWSRVEALLGRPLCTLGDHGRCEAAAERADVCAARALPIAGPGRDLRYLMALGPDRIDLYADDRPAQARVAIREYFQLLRGSGVHAVGSLAQLTDAFGRVVYDPTPGAPRLAASWFPSPAVGVTPAWSCAAATGHANTVLGADGGLCAVVQGAGTAHALIGDLLADPKIVLYGAKTGTIDSLADIARRPAACQAWNDHHPKPTQLVCGKAPPDDSLFVIAFGVVTAHGTVPITLGIQLQRGSKGSATHVAPEFVHAIADYLRN